MIGFRPLNLLVVLALGSLSESTRVEDFAELSLYSQFNSTDCDPSTETLSTTLQLGCDSVSGEPYLLECIEKVGLQLAVGFGDKDCLSPVKGKTYETEIIPRGCSNFDRMPIFHSILVKKETSLNSLLFFSMPNSPCLTDFEEYEEDLGIELLAIFGLNNITNATDPVLYEVRSILIDYGIVFIALTIVLGLLMCICGYKFFWLTLLLSGFVVCGYLGYIAWMQVCRKLSLYIYMRYIRLKFGSKITAPPILDNISHRCRCHHNCKGNTAKFCSCWYYWRDTCLAFCQAWNICTWSLFWRIPGLYIVSLNRS